MRPRQSSDSQSTSTFSSFASSRSGPNAYASATASWIGDPGTHRPRGGSGRSCPAMTAARTPDSRSHNVGGEHVSPFRTSGFLTRGGYETRRSRPSEVRLACLEPFRTRSIILDQLRWVQNGCQIRVSSDNTARRGIFRKARPAYPWPVRRLFIALLAATASTVFPSTTAPHPARSDAAPTRVRAEFATGRTDRFLTVALVAPNFEPLTELLGATGRIERVIARPGLTTAWGATWSPNRSLLAWVGPKGLTVERLDGSRRRLLVRNPGGCTSSCVPMTFAWSPDARRLAVGGAGKETNRLLVVSLRTGRSTEIGPTRALTNYSVFGWSRDGHLIGYIRRSIDRNTTSPTCALMVARADGSQPRRLFNAADSIHDCPQASLSPDGRSIAFTTEARDVPDPPLAIIDIATSRLRRIRINTFSAPVWSPDSKRVAVGGRAVLILAAADGQAHSVSVVGRPVAWTHSGDLFITSGSTDRNVLVARGGRRPARLLFRVPKNQSIVAIDPR